MRPHCRSLEIGTTTSTSCYRQQLCSLHLDRRVTDFRKRQNGQYVSSDVLHRLCDACTTSCLGKTTRQQRTTVQDCLKRGHCTNQVTESKNSSQHNQSKKAHRNGYIFPPLSIHLPYTKSAANYHCAQHLSYATWNRPSLSLPSH